MLVQPVNYCIIWSSSFLSRAGAMRGGRVREGDLCAIKVVKALGRCTGGEDMEGGSQRKKSHSI